MFNFSQLYECIVQRISNCYSAEEKEKTVEKCEISDKPNLLSASVDFSLANGVLFDRHPGSHRNAKLSLASSVNVIGHTLFPTPFPSSLYKYVVDIQYIINKLVHNMSLDVKTIIELLAPVGEHDNFIKHLCEITSKVYVNSADSPHVYPQKFNVGLLRSDYMLDQKQQGADSNVLDIKQIEINTISPSYICHSEAVTKVHRNLIHNHGENFYLHVNDNVFFKPNENIKNTVHLFEQALKLYINNYCLVDKPEDDEQDADPKKFSHCPASSAIPSPTNKKKPLKKPLAVVILVQNEEKNKYDQIKLACELDRHLNSEEYINSCNQVADISYVKIVFLPLKHIAKLKVHDSTVADDPDKGKLFLHEHCGESPSITQVGIVYFRCMYTPNDFCTDNYYQHRYDIERSLAIKMPNLPTQLTGAKIFQYYIKKSEFVTRYIDPAEVSMLFQVFTDIYAFENEEMYHHIKKKVLNNINNYVLKPQREGGGNNLYNEQMAAVFNTYTFEQMKQFIVMSLIKPPIYKNLAVITQKSNSNSSSTEQSTNLIKYELVNIDSVAELGVFGSFIAENHNKKKMIVNNSYGYLMRTKDVSQSDGGVTTGVALLDTPLFY